jgi:hypothetical protein
MKCAVRHTMDTVFYTPEQRAGHPGESMSSDLMSSATKPIKRPLVEAGPAANADQLDEIGLETTVQTKGIETTGAWDAYDVWRRFIKEARERRKGHDHN